ncbi:MAG: hypothetical protein ACLFU6_04225 [Candidatus Hydrogenedentota bacterium]
MLHPYEYSIVVVAKDHNPTLLNPDFLERNGIVPAEWGWEVDRDEVITTPPYSRVKYSSGILIESEAERFKAVARHAENGPFEQPLAGIVQRYVSVIEHVAYTAIGVNFQGFILDQDPLRTLLDNFAAPGFEAQLASPITGYGLTVNLHRREDARVTLRIAQGTRESPEGQEDPIINLRANYRRDLEPRSAVTRIHEILEDVQEDQADYYELVRALKLKGTSVQ